MIPAVSREPSSGYPPRIWLFCSSSIPPSSTAAAPRPFCSADQPNKREIGREGQKTLPYLRVTSIPTGNTGGRCSVVINRAKVACWILYLKSGAKHQQEDGRFFVNLNSTSPFRPRPSRHTPRYSCTMVDIDVIPAGTRQSTQLKMNAARFGFDRRRQMMVLL